MYTTEIPTAYLNYDTSIFSVLDVLFCSFLFLCVCVCVCLLFMHSIHIHFHLNMLSCLKALAICEYLSRYLIKHECKCDFRIWQCYFTVFFLFYHPLPFPFPLSAYLLSLSLSLRLLHSQIFNNLPLKVNKQPSRTVLYKHYDLYLADAPFFKIIKAISFCNLFFFSLSFRRILAHHIGVWNCCVRMCIHHEHKRTHIERERARERESERDRQLRRWFLHGRYK